MKFITLKQSLKELLPGNTLIYHDDTIQVDRFINTDKIIDIENWHEEDNLYNVFYLLYDLYPYGPVRIMCFGDITKFSKLVQTGGTLEGTYSKFCKVCSIS